MHIPIFVKEDGYKKISFVDITVRQILLILISWYQNYLSPHKGFSCAHRVLHGGESCSCYIKRTILEQDLVTSISLTRQRFRACSSANEALIIKSYEQVTAQLNATSFEERNQKGKAGVLKRRKFIQNMMLGFTIPLLSGARGNCRCCGELCLGPFFKSEEERSENDH